ncbi:MAG: hypothetical protein ACWGQW_08900 [bacterium]
MEFPWSKAPEPDYPEPTSEPTDPILPCGVEKVVVNGDEILLDRARVVHSIDGTVIRGYVVDPISGMTTQVQKMVPVQAIGKHVAMGWRNSDKTLHEMLSEPIPSLNR